MCHKTIRDWFHCISLCHIFTWNLKSLKNVWTVKVVMDLKFLQVFVLMGLKSHAVVGNKTNKNWRTIKRECKLLPQIKRKFLVEEWFLRYPILGRYREVTSKRRCQSAPQKSVRYTKVSAIMCPLHRIFSMRVWSSFHLFPRNLSFL